ncbi:MAG: hypothetical protein CSA95_07340 [Bacteroidetes bacterium]|nr:MAG: hypothetical protein CSA95_07340 [Bacteroidota bacterium]PIE87926.1 MAG: hypothetical protein CSA04_04495 [Bacteroidota bacterium]
MKRFIPFFMALSLLVMLSSCGEVGKERRNKLLEKPGSSGATYEMLVVCGTKVWEGAIGETIRTHFSQLDSTINQGEPLYTTPHITQETFDKNSMFQNHRNVLQVVVDPTNTSKLERVEDKYSKPQRIFRFRIRNEADFMTLFDTHKELIYKAYVEAERIRINRFFYGQRDGKMAHFLQEKFGLTLTLPNGFQVAKEAENFAWLWRKTPKIDYGILVYTEPYEDTVQLDKQAIVRLRDIITFDHIPGDLPESYMQVVTDKFPVSSYPIAFNGFYAMELRGLWETVKDYMGGPFLHYAIVDEKNNRIIHLDAFLYAPGQNKRNELLQLEAILYTLKITDPA